MKVSSMMEKNVIFFERGEKAREAAAKMIEHNIHQLVLRDGRMITAERMIDARPEPGESIRKLAKNYGHLEPGEKDMNALRKIVSAGVRALPVMEDGKVVGILGRWNFLGKVNETDVELIAHAPVITISMNESISKVWKIMKERSISMLPVVSGGTMEGIVRDIDLLKTIAFGGKTTMKRGPVSNIMEGVPEYFEDVSFSRMLDEVKRFGALVLTRSRKPIAVVTEKDLIDRLMFKKRSYNIELINVSDPLVEKYARAFFDKMEKMVKISGIVIHSKPAKSMKEMKVRVYTDMGDFIYTETAREELSAVQKIMDTLEEKIKSKRKKIRDLRRRMYWEVDWD